MRTIAEFDEKQVMRHVNAIGANIPVAWAEPYDDFCLFLEDAGIAVDNLPTWSPATAVMAVAASQPLRFWLKRTNRADRRRAARLAEKCKAAIAYTPIAEMAKPPWVRLNVVAIVTSF